LGIPGSPLKNGNVDAFLSLIMNTATEKGLQTETVNLSGIRIKIASTAISVSQNKKRANIVRLKMML